MSDELLTGQREGEDEVLLVVEGADAANLGALAVKLSPEFVVGVGRELDEAEGAAVVGDEALNGEGFGVFEVDDGTGDVGATFAFDLAFDDTLHGGTLLRSDWSGEQKCGGRSR